jgi:hypothetical protein
LLLIKDVQNLGGGLIILFLHLFGPLTIGLPLLSYLAKPLVLLLLLLLQLLLGLDDVVLELIQPLLMLFQNSRRLI